MNNHKIIFTGPVGAGKTTAITSISDISPVLTDEAASDMTKNRKDATTVAMDYGVMNLDGSDRIHLYGTPGQERFNFMWDILSEGGIGLVLLVNNSRPDPFQDMRFFLNAFDLFIDQTNVVIGVTRMDECINPTITDYHQQFKHSGKKIPIFEVDARERQDVSLLVEALLYSLDPELVG
ncbi:MAG: ATP/GTP-binding protein [Candidatus Thiodiazotropha sp. (ex Codakia rugifera)]|nr:ATP/GTP-binding protein [Candidatus Thiodiazotropha sp. (ex Codakia rugifera)]